MGLVLVMASTPLGVHTNAMYRRFKRNMVDGDVYDIGDMTYPAMTSGVTFTVTGASASGSSVQILHNGVLAHTLVGRTGYTFTIKPAIGRNVVQAVQGSDRTPTIDFVTDQLHTLIYPLARVLGQREEEIRQAWANGYLDTDAVNDANGNPLSPTAASLSQSWAEYLDVPRISTQTVEEFVQSIQAVLQIYQQGAVVQSLEDSGQAAGGDSGELVPNRVTFPGVANVVPHVQAYHVTPGDTSNAVSVFPGQVRMNNRLYNVAYVEQLTLNQSTAPATGGTGSTWVVLDPTDDASGASTGTLTPVVTGSEPRYITTTYEETFSTSEILEDTDGSITGMVGGKYIILERPAISISDITGATLSLSGASRVVQDSRDQNTCVVDLGTRMAVTAITSSSIMVQYTAPRSEVIVLARVVVSGSGNTVTDIEDVRSSAVIGQGGIYQDSDTTNRGYRLYLTKAAGFTDEEKAWAMRLIRKTSPAAAGGLLFFNEAGYGDLDIYHDSGYQYYGVI